VKKKVLVAASAPVIAAILVAAVVLPGLGVQEETSLYTYPFSIGDKTYNITLETNWNNEQSPTVSLTNSSEITRHAIILYFLGGSKKTLTYNITIPTDLLGGNISLVWKYYQQNPDRYLLTNNGTHNSVQMTFDYSPPFSGTGYFEIAGTKVTW
jgi:hypothetical protein